MNGHDCAICRFWNHPTSTTTGRKINVQSWQISECLRHAPRSGADSDRWAIESGKSDAVWPMTRADDWCGDFEGRMP